MANQQRLLQHITEKQHANAQRLGLSPEDPDDPEPGSPTLYTPQLYIPQQCEPQRVHAEPQGWGEADRGATEKAAAGEEGEEEHQVGILAGELSIYKARVDGRLCHEHTKLSFFWQVKLAVVHLILGPP